VGRSREGLPLRDRGGTGFNFGTPKHAAEIDLRRDELHGLSAFALEDGVVYASSTRVMTAE
jgi:hypothetical protein